MGRTGDDEWPPPLAVLAAVGGVAGVLPGVLFAVVAVLTGGLTLPSLLHPPVAVSCAVAPWLLGLGAVRLLSRRDRWPLLLGGAPATAALVWVLHGAAYGDGPAWPALLLLGPGAAPLLALAPSVGAWLHEGGADRTTRHPGGTRGVESAR